MADQQPEFPTLTPYLVVSNGTEAIDFYGKALGAKLLNVVKSPEGDTVMNAQLQIGDSMLMLNDEFPSYGVTAPKPGERVHITIHINSKDIEADWKRAVDAGMEVVMPLQDQFWGDRYGQLRCPFGYTWSMGMKIKDLTSDEIEKAMAAS